MVSGLMSVLVWLAASRPLGMSRHGETVRNVPPELTRLLQECQGDPQSWPADPSRLQESTSPSGGSHIIHALADLSRSGTDMPLSILTPLTAEQRLLLELLGDSPLTTFLQVQSLWRLRSPVEVTHGLVRHYSLWYLRASANEEGLLRAQLPQTSLSTHDTFPRVVMTVRADVLYLMLHHRWGCLAFTERTLIQSPDIFRDWRHNARAACKEYAASQALTSLSDVKTESDDEAEQAEPQQKWTAPPPIASMSLLEVADSVRHWRQQLNTLGFNMEEEHFRSLGAVSGTTSKSLRPSLSVSDAKFVKFCWGVASVLKLPETEALS